MERLPNEMIDRIAKCLELQCKYIDLANLSAVNRRIHSIVSSRTHSQVFNLAMKLFIVDIRNMLGNRSISRERYLAHFDYPTLLHEVLHRGGRGFLRKLFDGYIEYRNIKHHRVVATPIGRRLWVTEYHTASFPIYSLWSDKGKFFHGNITINNRSCMRLELDFGRHYIKKN